MEKKKEGTRLEKELEGLLDGLKRTSNSGAHWDNSDLSSKGVILEAKVKNTLDSFTCPKKELKKLKKQSEKSFKHWIYVQENSSGTYALMDIALLEHLWRYLPPDSILKS